MCYFFGRRLAGETVFFLPFVLARVFRPTFLEVFGLTNFQLGTVFALYGLVAMVSYFPGGVLADLLSPRKLLALALVATSGGGLLLASIPSLATLKLLYAYWGVHHGGPLLGHADAGDPRVGAG